MTSLTLFHSHNSPYVRKVMVLAHEAGLAGDITLVENASGNPLDPGAIPVAANPLGKIPVLLRSDGSALYDSRVICQYLDARAQSGLYPNGPRKWDALVLEATADGMLDAALLMVYEHRLRPDALQFPAYIDGQWSKIARSLDLIEDRWMAYLAGPLCIGQIALACALGYLDLRHAAQDWRQGRPALTAWQIRIAARESLRVTAPPEA